MSTPELPAPTRRVLALPWGQVSLMEWEPTGTPRTTVVLLHGGGYDSAELSWGAMGGQLARAGYRVIAPDAPGYGESPVADWPMTQERLVEFVGEVIDTLGLQRYVVGGLSMGGGMTLGHVLERPDGIQGVILLGSYGLADSVFAAPFRVPGQLLSWAVVTSGLMGVSVRTMVRYPFLVRRAMKSLLRNPAQRTPALERQILAEGGRGTSIAAFRQWQRSEVLPTRLRTTYTGRLAAIQVPTLLIHGEGDAAVPLVAVREAAEQFPDGRLMVVSGAGHWVQRDHPELVIPAVLEYLDAVLA